MRSLLHFPCVGAVPHRERQFSLTTLRALERIKSRLGMGKMAAVGFVLTLVLSQAQVFAFSDGKAEYLKLVAALKEVEQAASRVQAQEDLIARYDAEAPNKQYVTGDPYLFGVPGRKWAQQRNILTGKLAPLQAEQKTAQAKADEAFTNYKAATAKIDALMKQALEIHTYIRQMPGSDDSNRNRALCTIERDMLKICGKETEAYVEVLAKLQSLVHMGRPIDDLNKDLEDLASANPALKGLVGQFNDLIKDTAKLPLPERMKQIDGWLGKAEKALGALGSLFGNADSPFASKEAQSLSALVDLVKEMMPDDLAPVKSYMTIQLALLEGINNSIKDLNYELAKKNLVYLREFGTEPVVIPDPYLRFQFYRKSPFGEVATCPFNLNGHWNSVGWIAPNSPDDVCKVRVSVKGERFVATLETGNSFIPTGQVELYGTLAGTSFAVQEHYAYKGFVDPVWLPSKITIQDNDHFQLTQHHGPEVKFTRIKSGGK